MLGDVFGLVLVFDFVIDSVLVGFYMGGAGGGTLLLPLCIRVRGRVRA